MTYRCLLFVFAMVLASVVHAATSVKGTLSVFSQGENRVVFFDDATLRKAPSVNSPAFLRFPLGTPVTVLETASRAGEELPLYMRNGLLVPWVKVKVADQTGFMWGGLLSETALEVDLDRDGTLETILTGAVALSENTDSKQTPVLQNEIRIIRDGKLMASRSFASRYLDVNGVEATLYHPPGFTPQVDILKLDYAPQACGVTGGRMLFAWNGQGLLPVLEAAYGSDAGAYSNSFELTFPKEVGGQENTIRLTRTESTDWDESTGDYRHHVKTVKDYVFENGIFHERKPK